MHINIHFLKTFDLFWKGAIIITPIIPLIMGDPPTTATAVELIPNHGYKKNARVIERALKMPKYKPNAVNKYIKFLSRKTVLIA